LGLNFLIICECVLFWPKAQLFWVLARKKSMVSKIVFMLENNNSKTKTFRFGATIVNGSFVRKVRICF
jgi:hypothetical protein